METPRPTPTENITVSVRIRPINNDAPSCIQVNENEIRVEVPFAPSEDVLNGGGGSNTPNKMLFGTPSKATPSKNIGSTPAKTTAGSQTPSRFKTFTFNKIYGESSTQEQVFEDVAPYVTAAVGGYTSTVFAYGPTGSGKTYTIHGDGVSDGIVPSAIDLMFETIASNSSSSGAAYSVGISFVELYNDQFIDLLAFSGEDRGGGRIRTPKKGISSISVHRTPTKGVFLSGSDTLSVQVASAVAAKDLVKKGLLSRTVASTQCNERSSRSHCILILDVQSTNQREGQTVACCGKLFLVDLAGSERVAQSGAAGQALTEACRINSSLTALADVLSALTSTAPKTHVPYRNSKLTMLLQDALGGNSKTLMIACINPNARFASDVSVALSYAARAKMIRNQFRLNNMDLEGSLKKNGSFRAHLDNLQNCLEERISRFRELIPENEDAALLKLEEIASAVLRERNDIDGQLKEIINGHGSMTSLESMLFDCMQRRLENVVEQSNDIKSEVGMLEHMNSSLKSQLDYTLQEKNAACGRNTELMCIFSRERNDLLLRVQELEALLEEERRQHQEDVAKLREETELMRRRATAFEADIENLNWQQNRLSTNAITDNSFSKTRSSSCTSPLSQESSHNTSSNRKLKRKSTHEDEQILLDSTEEQICEEAGSIDTIALEHSPPRFVPPSSSNSIIKGLTRPSNPVARLLRRTPLKAANNHVPHTPPPPQISKTLVLPSPAAGGCVPRHAATEGKENIDLSEFSVLGSAGSIVMQPQHHRRTMTVAKPETSRSSSSAFSFRNLFTKRRRQDQSR